MGGYHTLPILSHGRTIESGSGASRRGRSRAFPPSIADFVAAERQGKIFLVSSELRMEKATLRGRVLVPSSSRFAFTATLDFREPINVHWI